MLYCGKTNETNYCFTILLLRCSLWQFFPKVTVKNLFSYRLRWKGYFFQKFRGKNHIFLSFIATVIKISFFLCGKLQLWINICKLFLSKLKHHRSFFTAPEWLPQRLMLLTSWISKNISFVNTPLDLLYILIFLVASLRVVFNYSASTIQ